MDKLAAFFITLIIMTTIVVSVTKPALHKQVMITNADFSFVEEPADDVRLSSSQTVQQTAVQPPQPAKTSQAAAPQSVKKSPANSEQTKPQKTVNTTQPAKKTQTVQKAQPVKSQPAPQKTVKKTQTTKVTQAASTVKTSQQKPAQPKTTQQKPTQTVKKEEPKTQAQAPTVVRQLTEQEEIIAWNKWRSDLQNQVMRDTKISAPLGTTFKFSFTVDKFGNLSNIKVWSLNPVYSETAVRVIKPVLAGYQGKPILNFPQGTKRVITNVTGGFTMATSTGYSKPSDYSDYERVKK